MSDDGNNEAQATAPAMEEDVNTTPPNPPAKKLAGDGWQMPEPVFRSTSGYLPQGFEKRFPQQGNSDDEPPTAPAPERDALDVEPQPDIGEVAEDPSEVPEPPAPSRKSGAARILLALFGLLVAFGLVAVFVAVVYFLFLSPSVNGTIE